MKDKMKKKKRETNQSRLSQKRNSKERQSQRKKTQLAQDQMPTSRRLAFLGMLVAVAMIFSYMETFIPVNLAVPGIKLGLANIVTIVVLNRFSFKDAVMVSLIRILLSNLLFGNFSMLLYSLAGAVCSILIMWIFIKIRFFSLTGISILGGVFHNLGQLLAASVFMENQSILYYMPVLLITGTITGIVVGIAASFISKSVKIS